jgi:hypothetical protein
VIHELFRVTRIGGCIVVATLNSQSPWADRRRAEGKRGHPLFKNAVFRSPDQLEALSPVEGIVKTAIHFQKHDHPLEAMEIEMHGRSKGLETGAFLAARWEKPDSV